MRGMGDTDRVAAADRRENRVDRPLGAAATRAEGFGTGHDVVGLRHGGYLHRLSIAFSITMSYFGLVSGTSVSQCTPRRRVCTAGFGNVAAAPSFHFAWATRPKITATRMWSRARGGNTSAISRRSASARSRAPGAFRSASVCASSRRRPPRGIDGAGVTTAQTARARIAAEYLFGAAFSQLTLPA